MEIENLNLKFKNSLTPFRKSITKIVCHHPVHTSWGVKEIHEFHQKPKSQGGKGWNGIGYNYFITFDGEIQEGRGRNQGAHCSGRNDDTLGVCFQGNFETQTMTDAQVKAGAQLIAKLLRDEGLSITDVIGHKDVPGSSTACPGRNFRMNDLKQAILETLNPKVKASVVTAMSVNRIDANVKFEGKQVKGFIEDGRTYVQVRDLAEMLGLVIEWDQPTKTVNLK